MLRKLLPVLVLVSVFVAAGADASTLGGGATVSSAPQLPFDTYFTDGTNSTDHVFWRVPLQVGDKLTFDYGQVSDDYVTLLMYAPGLTDYNYSQSSYVDHDSTV